VSPRTTAAVLCTSGLLACSLSGRFDADAGADAGPQPRGSVDCQAWQRAFCDFASDRCGVLGREPCDEQNAGVVCQDDTHARTCADAFQDAPCGRAPAGCEVADIADRRAAAAACERFFTGLCESNTRCGLFESLQECLTTPPFAFDCDRALSISPNLDRCLSLLEQRRCDQDVPLCDGIVRAR